MTLLQVQGLSVRFGGTAAVDGVNLTLAEGETLALTGESGSGKSLTALAVMGLLPPVAEAGGAVLFRGRDLRGLPDRHMRALRGSEIGLVFQEPMSALNPVQTIGDQIEEVLRLPRPGHVPPRRAEARARVRALLDRVGLSVPPSRYPHELSGGQRQRVVIAMAVANRPRLLIADEPTTALDVTTQAQILDLLKSLTRSEGMALLMITHDLAVVAGMANRIAVMQAGRVVEQGPAATLLAAPRHPYTQALLAASTHTATLPPPRPGAPFLRLDRVSCHYRLPRPHPLARAPVFEAVRSVSLTLHAGERVGLVGESGCGKSTLARAILGLEPTAEGRIALADGDPHRHRRIQAVFQDPYGSFNPRHRVARLLGEPFHLRRTPPRGEARHQALAEALTAVGLSPDMLGRHIHAFSGGQRQRLAIARALMIRPEMIVFDEAVSALDVRVRAQILDLLAALAGTTGLGWLFISHDLSVVRAICDRVLVMRAGQIVEDGPAEQVFSDPQHPYTRALLAATPRLPGRRAG
ncbi:ABC transporter ATP-binding protein [Ponticoccus sp. (in: a-proteobacteria)]|uniref:ABC transporter ATP-binding protein n=1 Tax=Ponticoccus sp. (in: a-proteobacteria) TaxID=1925025 RepID=UPI003AB2B3B6